MTPGRIREGCTNGWTGAHVPTAFAFASDEDDEMSKTSIFVGKLLTDADVTLLGGNNSISSGRFC